MRYQVNLIIASVFLLCLQQLASNKTQNSLPQLLPFRSMIKWLILVSLSCCVAREREKSSLALANIGAESKMLKSDANQQAQNLEGDSLWRRRLFSTKGNGFVPLANPILAFMLQIIERRELI